MKFNAKVQKLSKGWVLFLSVKSQKEGIQLIKELKNIDSRNPDYSPEKLEKLEGSVVKSKKQFHVKVYRSKLAHAQQLIKEWFLRNRDLEEKA